MESEAGAEPNANPNDGELDSVTLLCTWNKDLSEGNFQKAHIISFFQKAARKYFEYQPERAGVGKCGEVYQSHEAIKNNSSFPSLGSEMCIQRVRGKGVCK